MQCLDYKKPLITKVGRDLILGKIAELNAQYEQSISANADRAARSAGCCNGQQLQDDVTRQHNMLRTRIEVCCQTLERARLIPELPTSRRQLGIGHVGTYRFWTLGPGRKSKEHRIQMQIVGLYEEDPQSTPIRISYRSELAQAFLDMPVGACEEGVLIMGAKRTVTLTAIRYPDDPGVIRPPTEPPELRVVA